VQSQQWRARHVGVKAPRELYNLLLSDGGAGGKCVTLGTFALAATQYAGGKPIELVDGRRLLEMGIGVANEVRQPRLVVANPHTSFTPDTLEALGGEVDTEISDIDDANDGEKSPLCPRCQSPMAMLTGGGAGAAAGVRYWACTRVSPPCKGTRPA